MAGEAVRSIVFKVLKALAWMTLGVCLTALAGGIWYLEGRPDLKVWHTADLDEEFTANGNVATFNEYLRLEDRLFTQLDKRVYARIEPADRQVFNRFHVGSLADPGRWQPNWNRSFELRTEQPVAGVLLLHGMSDSPYSLRALGEKLASTGAWVVGLRLPGHGTAPAGLTGITWQDMAAATRLGAEHLREEIGERPLYIVGYSNGGALAVQYMLETLENDALPRVDGIVLMSPSIGVTGAARFAVWQGRLGHWLGMPKLEWQTRAPEYDPFKYGSFAVNAGDVVYRLTVDIQNRLERLGSKGALEHLPPIIAFQSVVDATVSTPALVTGLFGKLPAANHELVLFDIDRNDILRPLLADDRSTGLGTLMNDSAWPFSVTLITNASPRTSRVVIRHRPAGEPVEPDVPLDAEWPPDIFSLSHVALPIPPTDPLYGAVEPAEPGRLYLGNLSMRGERGLFQIPPSAMLRLRWNPFYDYLEGRILRFMALLE